LVRDFRRASGRAIATSASRRECLKFWFASRLGVTAFLRLPYQALQIPVRVGRATLVTPGLLDAAHREGLAVHVWTIDDPAEMKRLLDLGVDGLMSDHPDRLVAAVLERGCVEPSHLQPGDLQPELAASSAGSGVRSSGAPDKPTPVI
jgi:glycerophosphoryl diester phosphodiesterase